MRETNILCHGIRLDGEYNHLFRELLRMSKSEAEPLPLLVSGLAYWLGTRNFHLTKMMETQYPESDREPKLKKDKKDNSK